MSSSADELSNGEPEPASEASNYTPKQYSQHTQTEDAATTQAGTDATQDEDSEDYTDRENRFDGPAGTWRKYTAEERSLAASLDHERAGDLSVHLYNAHALKARLRDPHLAASAESWRGKQQWIALDKDGKRPWHPDSHWTAWPLPADEVPRKEETFSAAIVGYSDDEGTYCRPESWKPSADLEEELQALVLRKAKERYRRRRWLDGNQETSQETDGTDTDDDTKSKRFVFPGLRYGKPELIADDEQAQSTIQPSIRHIISKFNDLLVGLHKSRAGYRRQASTSQSRSRSKAAVSRSRSRSKKPTTRGRSTRRSKATGADDADSGSESGQAPPTESDADEDEDSEPLEQAPKKRRPSGPSRHDLGLRDWSEVLGTASLVGWDQAIVDRAARRCASLFGEGMAFRTMPETAADQTRDEFVEYRPEMVPELESEVEEENESEAVIEHMYQCPYQDCARHLEAYTKAWRWREHLKKQHKLGSAQVEDLELRCGLGKEAAGNGNSTDSLNDVGEGPAPGGGEQTVHEEVDALESDGKQGMFGGVHVDGFMQPISGKIVHRGRDKRERRRRSTNERQELKRPRMAHEHERVTDNDGEEDEEHEDIEMRHLH